MTLLSDLYAGSGYPGTGEQAFLDADHTKLDGIENSATADNISDANVTDLTDGFDTTLHDHDGISENTSARHTQGSDTALGAQAENLDMNTHKVVGVVDPTTDQEAATKKYVDDHNTHYVQFRILDKDTSHTTGTGKGGELRIPEACAVLDVGAYFDTAGTTSVTTIDINEAGTTILSTKITVDATEKSSETAATSAVISDSAIAADAILTFDVDGIASGTAGKGLVVWMKVRF